MSASSTLSIATRGLNLNFGSIRVVFPPNYSGSPKANITTNPADHNDEAADIYMIDNVKSRYMESVDTLQFHAECGREQGGVIVVGSLLGTNAAPKDIAAAGTNSQHYEYIRRRSVIIRVYALMACSPRKTVSLYRLRWTAYPVIVYSAYNIWISI